MSALLVPSVVTPARYGELKSAFNPSISGSREKSLLKKSFFAGDARSTLFGTRDDALYALKKFTRANRATGVRCGPDGTTQTGKTTYNPITSPSTLVKKESDIRIVKLNNDTFSLRGSCNERLKFEIEYSLKKGTTENSYVIKTEKSNVLIDVPDQSFAESFVKKLPEVIDVADIDVILLGHLSPKRVESLVAVHKARPEKSSKLKIYCSNPAYKTLCSALSEETVKEYFDVFVVKQGDNDSIDLGNGRELQLILTPTPRWPDGLFAYDTASLLLFSQKIFSGHICEDSAYDIGGWDVYGESWKFFYDCMLAPVAKQVNTIFEKLQIVGQFTKPSYSGKIGLDVVKADIGYIWNSLMGALNLGISLPSVSSKRKKNEVDDGTLVVSALCPLHGPIVKSSLTELIREYKEWTQEKLKQADEAKVAVIYASAYGNTSALAQAISRGILKAGVGTEMINCEESAGSEVVEILNKCSGFVIGSPTLGGHMPTPVQETLGAILKEPSAREKPCGVFGSFGWSGEAVDEIEQRLKDGGFSFSFPSIRCKFKPTENMLQICEESGTDLAQTIKKKKMKQKARESTPLSVSSNVEQAVGRVVGSLCVVSAKNGDAESAMLASWVSQASFNPPGITLAVAKDRAIEGLVLPNSTFVINVLGGDKVGPVSKQLLKPFKPGEPRFGNLRIKPSNNGSYILEDAIAYLECTVENRMETGDHFVIYAIANDGNLLDDKSLTAIHHRKTGTRY